MDGKPSRLAQAKSALRQRMRAARAALPAAERAAHSHAIATRLTALPELQSARRLFAYLAIEPEVQTQPLIRRWLDEGRALAVPRLEGPGHMRAVGLRELAGLRPGVWGIPSPPATAPTVEAIDVALVPGLAFDRLGRRLGHGAGYYDRWLAAHPRALRIGIAYECQLVPEVPAGAHDVPMHLVVTERRVIRTGTGAQPD